MNDNQSSPARLPWLWAAIVHAGKPVVLPAGLNYHLQNASLTGNVVATQQRTELVLSFSPGSKGLEAATICVLTPSKIEQTVLSINLGPAQACTIAVNGPNPVSIVGSSSQRFDLGQNVLAAGSASKKPPAEPSGQGHKVWIITQAQRPDDVPVQDPKASSSLKPLLQSAARLVMHGSKITGLYAMRISGNSFWLSDNIQASELFVDLLSASFASKFNDVVVGQGHFPRVVELQLLGLQQDIQRTLRVPAKDILLWIKSAGFRVSADSTVVLDFVVHSVDNNAR